jgi:hypothetical protein
MATADAIIDLEKPPVLNEIINQPITKTGGRKPKPAWDHFTKKQYNPMTTTTCGT